MTITRENCHLDLTWGNIRMRLRRIRNKSLLCMIVLTMVLLAINFILVEKHRVVDDRSTFASKVNTVNESNVIDEKKFELKPNITLEVLSNAKINLIMGYMRTGSSFAGVTLQEFQNTFYLYEPIRTVWEKFWYDRQQVTPFLYPNGKVVNQNLEDRDKIILQEVRDYMTCSFGNISVFSLLDKFHRSKTKLMKKLRWCTEVQENITNADNPLYGIPKWVRCLEEVRYKCLTAPVRLLKFIRLPMSELRKIIPQFPNMKILHLHRDPRAIFNSRAHLNDTPQTDSDQEVADHCNQWFEDIEVARDIAKEYPGRFKTVRYEDITQYQNDYFADICNFFGIDFEPDIKAYLTKVTSVAEDGGPWGFERANPYQTAMKWRQELNYTKASLICSICEKPMNELKYYSFSNAEDMANVNLPVRGPMGNVSVTESKTETEP